MIGGVYAYQFHPCIIPFLNKKSSKLRIKNKVLSINFKKKNMIKNSIKLYQELYIQLGRYMDDIELGAEGRDQIHKKYTDKMNKKLRDVAIWLHDNYEEIAKGENWDTQESCKVEFDSLPQENKAVMIELARRICMI